MDYLIELSQDNYFILDLTDDNNLFISFKNKQVMAESDLLNNAILYIIKTNEFTNFIKVYNEFLGITKFLRFKKGQCFFYFNNKVIYQFKTNDIDNEITNISEFRRIFKK